MEERSGEAFAGTEPLTVIGKLLQAGDPAPDFRLDYLDLVDLAVRTISLADSTGLVRLLNVVNSLQHPLCQQVTRQWEAMCAALPPEACMYTVSMDSPQMQAGWQDSAGVLHQALSAELLTQLGQGYGVWLKQGFAPLPLSYASRQGRCLLLDGDGEAANAFFALDSLWVGGYIS